MFKRKLIKFFLCFLCCFFVVSPAFTQQRTNSAIKVLESSSEKLVFRVTMPDFSFETIKTEYGDFQRYVLKNTDVSLTQPDEDNFSHPEFPIISTNIAVPIGANSSAKVEVYPGSIKPMQQVRLFPIQKPVYDAPFPLQSQFEFDSDIYNTANIKSGVAYWGSPYQSRQSGFQENNIYTLVLNLVDYIPGQQYLTVYTDFTVEVHFSGRYFSATRKNTNQKLPPKDEVDQWYDDMDDGMDAVVLNYEQMISPELLEIVDYDFRFIGANYIIVTDPAFQEAANTLRFHKLCNGISTIVVSTDNIGATKEEIKIYLENAYNTWFIQPKWVLLMGDAEFIPTKYTTYITDDGITYYAGDQYYVEFNDLEKPRIAIGRFPVDTLEQALVMVNNVIHYENFPPVFNDSYYKTLTFAACFEDYDSPFGAEDRGYIGVTENIRSQILSSYFFSIKRIYAKTPAAISDPFLLNPGDTWSGTSGDLIIEANAGRSLMYHRDHGSGYGWSHPSFTTTSLDSVSVPGSRYPVVYSINCSSGVFDNETAPSGFNPATVYWAEKFVRKTDGAIAVIGASRPSSTSKNNLLAPALFDATWQNVVSPYGDFNPPIRKVGDILRYGKMYLYNTQSPSSKLNRHCRIYNLLGDPTVELYSSGASIGFIIPHFECQSWPYLGIPVLINDYDPGKIARDGTPIIAVATIDSSGEPEVVGRGILRYENMKEQNVITLKLDDKARQAKSINLTISGTQVKKLEIQLKDMTALGDVNGDGMINIVDALLIAQYYVGLNPPGFNPDVADVNCDGEVDIIDALLIAQYYVGIITTFEGCDPTPGPTNPPEPVTYELQAEDATWSSGGFESDHAGYTGSGYVNIDNASGEWIEWSLNLEDATAACCNFRYACASDTRSMDLIVNSDFVTNLDFPASGAWTTWVIEESSTVSLNAGLNTIRLTATTSGGAPNLDRMDITKLNHLLTTLWSQHGEYKALTPVNPDGEHERLGCWSIAIAQMIKHLQLNSKGYQFYTGDKYSISQNCNFIYDFSKMPDVLSSSSTNAEKEETSCFCYNVAVIVRKDFGTNSYIGNSDFRRDELESHFNCTTSRVTSSVNTDNHTKKEIEKFIINEIDNNRACMLFTGGHAMVIDGYYKIGSIVHINFGWGGSDDGWFNLWEEIPTSKDTYDAVNRWIMSIVPTGA